MALSQLGYSDHVPIVLYAGLGNDQALYLGYEHNRVHLNNRSMTYEEVLLFRRKLPGNPDERLSQSQRMKWRKTMAQILGIDVKQVRNKYRHHTWLASQPNNIWSLIKETMKAWEKNELKGQRPGPLKPFHLICLEKMQKNEIEHCLQRLLNKQVSLQKIK
ncbi:uncharacterized protein LOC121431894 [Lytechinus variegatus]|uniref:uncharacterized protein LOC121431894 n=1 Tax=Lytechinus variegatus TaxID=7654 RepID=UPI001BB262B7|nr:uncharacterized protein LOC121431894 [Lytechinus variegatus]